MTAVAVDIGGTKIQVAPARWTSAEQVVEIPTAAETDEETVVRQVVDGVLAVAPRPCAEPVVVSTAASLDAGTGVVGRAANLPFRDYALARRLSADLCRPVDLLEDANAATVAEFTHGAGVGHSGGVYVTVSTGIGMGIVVDGRVLVGYAGEAGEFGHVPVALGPGAVRCRCGQRGCLEAYASGAGLAARARQPSARAVLDAARAGDPAASTALGEAIELLASAVAGAVRLLAPPVLVFGGGLMLPGGLLTDLRDAVGELLAPTVPEVRGRIVAARFGRFSALRGAGLVADGHPAAVAMLANGPGRPR